MDVLLVCSEDPSHTKLVNDCGTVNGQPVLDWWESVGRRCGPCRDRAVQLSLQPVDEDVGEATTLQEKFEVFHTKNPWVYMVLVKLARDLMARGRRRIGIGMLFEVLRWQYQMATVDPASDFKLNNNYRSRYARLIMENEPDLADAFEVRELKAA
jgi:hypothetical protein